MSPTKLAALREPTFIIEYGGALYVTESVLEYRRSDTLPDEQKKGVDGLYALYKAPRPASASMRAGGPGQPSGGSNPQPPPVVVDKKDVIAFMATKPPRPPGG